MERKLQDILDSAIPLTQAMGIIVERYSGRELTIVAPLANNFNHLGTAFGGSLYIACVLSAWGLLYLRLREAGVKGNIVIRKGDVEYLRPVKGDIVATGALPPDEEVAAFIAAFKETGKAKMTIHAVIEVEGKVAVKFEGAFAVVR
ncbi:MAG: thioesterase [Chlorobaculum sp.]|nr:thioesterase [Chlorobaculum sp.]